MITKLILVEGIPGSGKSTFARRIADYYTSQGIKTNVFNEGAFHPADLAWQACIPVEKLDRVLAPYASIRDEIDKHVHIEGDYAVIPYVQVKTDDTSFYRDMEHHEVYDNRVARDLFSELHERRWHQFGQTAEKASEMNVFECAFLQNHVSELLYFHLADIDEIKGHLYELVKNVSLLSPVLVYLSPSDVRSTIERIARQRVSQNGSWIDGLIRYLAKTPYGKLNGINGFDDVVSLMEKRKVIELEIIRTLPLKTIILDKHDQDWEQMWHMLQKQLPVCLEEDRQGSQ